MQMNGLTGTVPEEIFTEATSLTYLDLSRNEFTGTISTRFGELVLVQYLFLFMNQFIGTIPKEIGDMASLQFFQLPYNNLTGEVPSEVCRLRPKPLEELWTDCKSTTEGGAPKVVCSSSCCTACYEGYL